MPAPPAGPTCPGGGRRARPAPGRAVTVRPAAGGQRRGAPAVPPTPAGPPSGRSRLDLALVARGLAPTREKAARLILAGSVLVDGRRVDKAGAMVVPRSVLSVVQRPRFVSRGGDKLAHALAAFRIVVQGRVCVDIGASTGGFTHCLLEAGAARVFAVDVGQGQLDASLRADGRVVVMERTNARHLSAQALGERPTLAAIDVSFISLEKVLPAVMGALAPRGEAIVLAKPQFEVGKGEVGKGGVVREPAQHRAVLTRLARFAVLRGWHVLGVTASPLLGPKGNREFFLHLGTTGRSIGDLAERIDALLAEPPA
jgi:23S rRNA (cytidine1920-2'-O)/16S rRNA (cytidine1409-2'-O)-methyltransferase